MITNLNFFILLYYFIETLINQFLTEKIFNEHTFEMTFIFKPIIKILTLTNL